MNTVLGILGVMFILEGLFLIIRPSFLRRFVPGWTLEQCRYVGAVECAFGIMLLLLLCIRFGGIF